MCDVYNVMIWNQGILWKDLTYLVIKYTCLYIDSLGGGCWEHLSSPWSKSPVIYTVLLTVFTMLYISSWEPIHLTCKDVYPSTNISLFTQSFSPIANHFTTLYEFFFTSCKRYCTICVFLWLISLSTMPSRSIMLQQMVTFPFFSQLWITNILLCVYAYIHAHNEWRNYGVHIYVHVCMYTILYICMYNMYTWYLFIYPLMDT